MTIDQVVGKLISEKQNRLTSRFPCRVIMVRNVQKYRTLLEALRKIPGIEMVSSAELFSGSDVMPRFENMTNANYNSRWVILPGVSEYLRLFSKNEADTQRFAKLWSHQSPSNSIGRIIIPLWGCEVQWHDKSLHLTGDIRQNDYYYDCSDTDDAEQQMKVIVLADSFIKYVDVFQNKYERIITGLRAWYEYWSNPSADEQHLALITARSKSIQSVNGSVSVRVVQDTLTFIQENLNGATELNHENCPKEAEESLFENAIKCTSLDFAILSCLNISHFTPLDVMGRWCFLSTGQRQLVRLWFLLHPDNSYLSHCVLASNNLYDLDKHILHDIFSVCQLHPDWITESQDLIKAMKLNRDDSYFVELDKIPDYNERLAFLSSDTQRERGYLLRMVGMWIRKDEEEALESALLKAIYPALHAYLDGEPYDEDLRRYMKLYKLYKLSDTLPDDEHMFFAGIQTDSYYYRYTALSNSISDDCILLWLDAFGVEWLPLLLWSLKKIPTGEVYEVKIGQANLPTETEFNRQWEKMSVPYEKLDKLDKLAHKGVIDDPSYYSCIDEQIEFVTGIAQKVEALLDKFHRVIITGDHGASRLAARYFHLRDGIPMNRDWKAFNHGRYALVQTVPAYLPDTQVSVKDDAGNHYIVFRNYDHFVKQGFATGTDEDNPIFGELHGGATPEESLVPIVVFDRNAPLSIKAKWKQSTVKISMKRVRAIISFNLPINTLEACIGTHKAVVVALSNGKEWTITFSGVKDGTYSVSVVADGRLIPIETLTVLPAIGNSDGDLP